MKNSFKNPAVLVTLLANSAVALGGLIGWFTVSASLQAADVLNGSTLQDNLNSKKIVTIVVAVLCLLITLVVAKWNRRWLQVVPLLLDLFLAFVTLNQLSGKDQAEALGITYGVGYWLSLAASFIAAAGCLGIIATVRRNKVKKAK